MAKKLTIGANEVIVPEKSDIQTQIEASVANNLTTTDAGKVLDARQGKVLDDKKLDKVTTPDGYAKRAYAVNFSGNPEMQYFGLGPDSNIVVQRKTGGLIRIKSGNTASRPTTSLDKGDQYFNTTTNQMEIYIGDTNHWLNQKYSNGDTLPTPASGTSHTYLVVGSGTSVGNNDLGTIEIDGMIIFQAGISNTGGSTVVVSNENGDIFITNSGGSIAQEPANLILDASSGVSLLRIA